MAGRKVTHSEDWWATQRPDHVVRCTARLKKGDGSLQCRREAVPGLNVCGSHGGKTPAAIAAAFTRLGSTVEDAADTVAQIMSDTSAPPRDRLAAAAHVMKLLGMEKERHEVTVTVDPVEALFRSIVSDPDGLALPSDGNVSEAELERRRAAWAELIGEDDVVDAELVEDPTEDRTPAAIEASTNPPKESAKMPRRVREDLDRREQLRKVGLW
ncbi:hypothetical protein [Pimelobacter simplex]|uniref:hypothetical protein n=1 Tax=Nocardioides simplex TaxID=2045 RepID=UPI003AB10057